MAQLWLVFKSNEKLIMLYDLVAAENRQDDRFKYAKNSYNSKGDLSNHKSI